MIRKFLSIVAISMLVFANCNNHGRNEQTEYKKAAADTSVQSVPKAQDVPFSVAKNYFVKNTVKQGVLGNPKIETKENFDAIFGAATTMGNGKPAEIDFSRQYIIAVVGDETDIAAEISPVSLQKNDKNQITLTYSMNKGSKQSFKIRPLLIVVVDKSQGGTVSIKEQNL